MKKFICGILTGTILMTTVPALAETTKSINAVFGRVKVVVNGKPVEQETLLYNGTTYVPLRAVSEILDKEVEFDNINKIAYVDEKGTDRESILEDEKQALKDEYDSAITKLDTIIDIYNKGADYADANSYANAQLTLDKVVVECDYIINNYKSSSKALENNVKNFSAKLKKAANELNLSVTYDLAGNLNVSNQYTKTANATLKETNVFVDNLLNDYDTLFSK